jgi:hypothetical protein
MKNTRGRGFAYQPTYSEKQADGSAVKKTTSTWWISYSIHGKRRAHTPTTTPLQCAC